MFDFTDLVLKFASLIYTRSPLVCCTFVVILSGRTSSWSSTHQQRTKRRFTAEGSGGKTVKRREKTSCPVHAWTRAYSAFLEEQILPRREPQIFPMSLVHLLALFLKYIKLLYNFVNARILDIRARLPSSAHMQRWMFARRCNSCTWVKHVHIARSQP